MSPSTPFKPNLVSTISSLDFVLYSLHLQLFPAFVWKQTPTVRIHKHRILGRHLLWVVLVSAVGDWSWGTQSWSWKEEWFRFVFCFSTTCFQGAVFTAGKISVRREKVQSHWMIAVSHHREASAGLKYSGRRVTLHWSSALQSKLPAPQASQLNGCLLADGPVGQEGRPQERVGWFSLHSEWREQVSVIVRLSAFRWPIWRHWD